MPTQGGDLSVSLYYFIIYIYILFFSQGLGLGQYCAAGSDAGQLAVVLALVAASPATAATEAKGASQDPWFKFCANGEITSAVAAKDVASSVAQQLKHATQQLKHVSRLRPRHFVVFM